MEDTYPKRVADLEVGDRIWYPLTGTALVTKIVASDEDGDLHAHTRWVEYLFNDCVIDDEVLDDDDFIAVVRTREED